MSWLLTALLAGCAGNILSLYEQEKDKVLAAPPAAGTDWEPELRLTLSDGSLQDMAGAAVDAGLLDFKDDIEFKGPLNTKVVVTPKASVKSLSVQAGRDCGGCLKLNANLKGKAKWKAGSLDGSLPFTAQIGGTVGFDVTQKGKTFKVSARVVEVDSVKLASSMAGQVDLSPYLQGWTEDALAKAPSIELGTFGGDDLPVRALRIDSGSGGVELQALTDVAGGTPVDRSKGRMSGDWRLSISQPTALALMRRAAFEMGALEEYDIALDPRSLAVKDDGFTMGLRLWRLTGRGWWRDYTIHGAITTTSKQIRLKSQTAEEGDTSKGAGLADPLALLVEGRILDAVAHGIHQVLPAQQSASIGDRKLSAATTSVLGRGDTLMVEGTLTISESSARRKAMGRGHNQHRAH